MRIVRRRQAGFSVIEVIAAFAILALTLGTLFSGVRISAKADRFASLQHRALRLGQSHLGGLGVLQTDVCGEARGEYAEGYRWSLTCEPATLGVASPLDAVWVRLTITRPGDQGVDLVAMTLTALKFQIERK
jgi:general secretion pathway protein I